MHRKGSMTGDEQSGLCTHWMFLTLTVPAEHRDFWEKQVLPLSHHYHPINISFNSGVYSIYLVHNLQMRLRLVVLVIALGLKWLIAWDCYFRCLHMKSDAVCPRKKMNRLWQEWDRICCCVENAFSYMPAVCLCLVLVVAFEQRSKRIILENVNTNDSKRRN